MRSAREIFTRLRQEARNVALLAFPPRCRITSPSELALPTASPIVESLQRTSFAATIIRLADHIVDHRIPLFDRYLATGPSIDWRRDYPNDKSTGIAYFRRVPYLDFARAGDHKNIWELNRHQHLVVLAQAHLLTGDPRYLRGCEDQLRSWLIANPFQRGINWTSALEVAFRAWSWIWIFHLVGSRVDSRLASDLLESLYQHGCHLETNLSFYFSPNTHLLGEAVVLHALGVLFPGFPRSRHWVELGHRTVLQQMHRQIRDDGSHFEQSTYYHVYALDMFLLHAILSDPLPGYRKKLRGMADYLATLMGSSRTLPYIGDDDGGRFFHPYGDRQKFGRATLATCAVYFKSDEWAFSSEDLYEQAAWWLGCTDARSQAAAPSARLFPESGVAVLGDARTRILFDAGPFGPGRAGHSHSDTLSLCVDIDGQPVLVDPGTFTYVSDPAWRNHFRGSGAHNTIRINKQNQAHPMGPFWWSEPPFVAVVQSKLDSLPQLVEAECRYRGINHCRTVSFDGTVITIIDAINGPPGEYELEQFWHYETPEAAEHMIFEEEPEWFPCSHSPVFGTKRECRCQVIRRKSHLPALFTTKINPLR